MGGFRRAIRPYPLVMSDRKKIVFVCTHNAGKSRLAEAYLNKVGYERFQAVSAGTEPSDSVNPAAVEAGAVAGIEVVAGPGVPLSSEVVAGADLVITFGCGVGGLESDAPVEDWQLLDESGRTPEDYDGIRDAITQRVDELIGRLGQKD